MPTRFEAYRMRDGVTPLAEDYFNPMLADIDARIAQLEDQRADLQRVIDDLTAFGLQRIDTLIGPAIASLNQALADALAQKNSVMASLNQTLAEATAQLNTLIAVVGNVANLATQAQLAAAIQAEQTERQQAIAAEQTAREAMDQQLLALIAAAL
jgi:DNA repair exonuclease SbcCD ATPase subunit